MHLHFERNVNSKCDCTILSLSWMGKVPDELPEEEGWKLNRNNYYQEGWLATGNIRGVVGVTFTSSHARRPHELPLRSNFNLRGHRSDVILVKWNEPYQKLASCDSSGVIFVWIKYEGRWSIELINDRSTPVTHFSWSHDGRMALICYQDGFVLVGSVAGQRYWSSMLSLDARITCGCWTPDDSQVYLGTANAQLVVMDVHGAMVSQVQLVDECGITSMAWSCEKFKMEEGDDVENTSNHVLAVALGNGEIVLLTGHDDVSPVRVVTGMRGDTLAMEWANSRELLAVAGTMCPEAGEPEDAPPYKNVVKFYTDTGILIYTVLIPCNQGPVSALTWGHAARRVFVGVGGSVCTARVWRAVAPLQLLARVRAAQALLHPRLAHRLPLPPRLQPALANLFAHTIRCNVPESSELRRFVSRPPAAGARLHCTMVRHGEDEHGCYTLYLEHLGGLVPLLKGRRTSKIRPEFVIFDPQAEDKAHFVNISNSSSSTTGKDSSSAASSSSAGSRKGSVKGVASPKGSPRTPRFSRRFASPQMHIDTSSSDTEREEGCAASPKMQRRRKARERRKARQSEREDNVEGLPVDCLPEDTRLVEVTSNIWGTKFKMHGLAKNVPANLGQVTYKTSLLHLQPRQMTLMITELRDDFPVGPDPTFNPNLFSEDEEDVFHSGESANESPSHAPLDRMKRKLTLVDRPTPMPAQEPHTAGCMAASLARAESYDEFPYMESRESGESSSDPPFAPRASVPGRHAISPLRCEASLPTLQSPKNAVAPTDIIFERPSPQAVSCGGRGDFYGRADYSVRSDSLALKNLVDQQTYVKKVDAATPDASCLSKLRKNICGRDSYEVNARILKSLCARTEGGKDELRYIDEEGSPPARVQRTTTVVPISPVCAAPSDTMTRSCSVGYLDLVDPRHAPVTVAALRGEPPRRLVLVNPRRQRRRRPPPTPPSPPAKSERAPSLRRCGKSRSLDSSDMPLAAAAVAEGARLKKLKSAKGKVVENSDSDTPRVTCSLCRLAAPIGSTAGGGAYVCTTCATRATPPALPPAPSPRLATDSDSDYSKYYSSLEQLALRLLASRATRRARADRETSSAPASPRAARSRPDSPAAIPSPRTPKPQRTRHSSSSPIRQLLNSPLLNRRRNKKPSESSDDEYSAGGYSEVNGKNFRDLESFQKAQLRNKLIRAGGVANTAVAPAASGECRARRQLVMHNKAPMWNENSQVYQLDFGGRVTQESAKNFQIEYHGKQVMQFGRIDDNAYTLDFQYPFSALQGFAVALANVTQRLK